MKSIEIILNDFINSAMVTEHIFFFNWNQYDFIAHFPTFLSFQYDYNYEVKDPEKMLFFDKNEAGDAQGKVNEIYWQKKIVTKTSCEC